MIHDELLKHVNDSNVVEFCKLHILLGLSEFFYPTLRVLYVLSCFLLLIIILLNCVNRIGVAWCTNIWSEVCVKVFHPFIRSQFLQFFILLDVLTCCR